MTDISVLIPTFRRARLLDRCLRSLDEQTAPAGSVEIVVVDDGSGDDTQAVLAEWSERLPGLRYLQQATNQGPAAARNRAIREAGSPLVLFVDDDIVVSPDLVLLHLQRHTSARDPMLGVLGRVEWERDLEVTAFMRWLDQSGLQFAYDTWLQAGPVEPPYAAFYTANLSVSRDLLLEEGGFDERFPYPAYEDIELAWRLAQRGFRMDYDPDLIAFHSRPIDLRTFCRRMAMVAESAELISLVQPGFPVDHGPPEAGRVRRRELWRLRARCRLPFIRPSSALQSRWFAAEVSRAYAEGRARARAELRRSPTAPRGR